MNWSKKKKLIFGKIKKRRTLAEIGRIEKFASWAALRSLAELATIEMLIKNVALSMTIEKFKF